MFICAKCMEAIGPSVPAHKVVVRTREVSYPERKYKNKGRLVHDPGGRGTQIIREVNMCKGCAEGE